LDLRTGDFDLTIEEDIAFDSVDDLGEEIFLGLLEGSD